MNQDFWSNLEKEPLVVYYLDSSFHWWFCTYLFGQIVSLLYGTLIVVFTDNSDQLALIFVIICIRKTELLIDAHRLIQFVSSVKPDLQFVAILNFCNGAHLSKAQIINTVKSFAIVSTSSALPSLSQRFFVRHSFHFSVVKFFMHLLYIIFDIQSLMAWVWGQG